MTKIGDTIIESGIQDPNPMFVRKTVRGIIINDYHQVLMAYSDFFDDYMFPGGGIKPDENDYDALIRELKEEVGALAVEIIEPFGYTEEIRYSMRNDEMIIHQISHYYVCKIPHFGKQELIPQELSYGLIPSWVDIDDVIRYNERSISGEKHQDKGLKTVLLRENQVLRKLKEYIDAKF